MTTRGSAGRSTVAVCAATLHRPLGLAALLESLAKMTVPDDVDLVVVITDNDAEGSAEPVVDAARASIRGDLRYVVEPRRGIPFARNAGVRAAPDADWVAFVDDDETVADDWLVELWDVAGRTGADVVTGTVLASFEVPPPDWVVAGRFFERPRFPTGTRIPYARTSNALVAARWLRESDAPFDVRMQANGGDDTHFFQRVRLGGGSIVWADSAVVEEVVPQSRVDVGWLVRREYRRGNTLSWCLRDLEDSWPRRIKRFGAGVLRCAHGLAEVVGSVVRGGKAARVTGMRRMAFGSGLITGLSGRAYQEYVTVHGR